MQKEVCVDILSDLVVSSLDKPFNAKKILLSRPDVYSVLKRKLDAFEYENVTKDSVGLIYPKLHLTGELPDLSILQKAVVMNLLEVFRVFHSLKDKYTRFSYF